MTDNDVQALKDFRAEMESSDVEAARARVRHKIARAVDAPAPKHRWIPVTATAGAAAAILIGTVVLLQPNHPSGTPMHAADQPTPKPTPTATAPQAQPSLAAVTLPRAEPGPLTAEGLTVGAGQLLYTRSRAEGYKHEQWSEPGGVIVIAIQREDDGRITVVADEASMKPDADQERATFAADGPGVAYPTAAFLAALPTDPQALRHQVIDVLAGSHPDKGIKATTQWLYRVEPFLTAPVRTGLVQALDSLPGVRIDHSARTFDGRPVYVVQQSNTSGVEGLIVDSATGRVIGSYAAGPGHDAWATANRWEYAVVNR